MFFRCLSCILEYSTSAKYTVNFVQIFEESSLCFSTSWNLST